MSKKKQIISPAYLFQKLGKNLAISTTTGDFYDLPSNAYHKLKRWNHQILKYGNKLKQNSPSPAEYLKYFPFAKNKKHAHPDKIISPAISDLTLNLTSSCNLACVYCWNDQGKYSNRKFSRTVPEKVFSADNPVMMSAAVACRAVDLLVALKGKEKKLVVDFYGGEPLLNLAAINAVIDYCRKNESRWKVNIRFLIATNGTLLTPQLAEALIAKGVQIAVSIDGKKVVHDHNRPFIDGRGSFAVIAGNLKHMPRAIMKKLVGRATVTPFYTDLLELYRGLRGLGFERIELFESEDACHRLTPQREKAFFLKEQQYRKLFKEYERLALFYIEEVKECRLDYSKTFFNRFFKLMQRVYYQQAVSGGCPAGIGQLAISAQGEVYPCTAFIGIRQFNLGDVKSGLDKKAYDNFLRKAGQRTEKCRKCEIFSLCRATGSCLNLNHYYCKDISVPYALGCRFFKFKVELAIAALAVLSDKIPYRLDSLFGSDPAGKRGIAY